MTHYRLTEGLIVNKTPVAVIRSRFQEYLHCFNVMLCGSILKVHESPWMTGQTWVNTAGEGGEMKCVCVCVWESILQLISGEVSSSLPQHLHNILTSADIEKWHTERQINYIKSYESSVVLYHLFNWICVKLTRFVHDSELVSAACECKSSCWVNLG